jgi:hypothetical protein
MAGPAEPISIAENPLAGGSFVNWVRLWRANAPVERRYGLRAAYITTMTVLWSPLRILHRVLFGRRIRKTRIREAPVFILGHYRSGTTYLQNLMTRDPQWGFISTTQAVLPELFLLGPFIRKILGLFLPEKRPMDNMEMSPDLPEEPEHAVGNLSRYCFYHGFCFPRRMMHYVNRYVLFRDVPRDVVDGWKEVYLRVLKAATLTAGGRRLVIKNPADTARIRQLLEMFPDARFIFLYRDPYVMYPSIHNFYSANIRDWKLQEISDEALRENIFTIYREFMERYQADKTHIPPGNLVEVKFEDVEVRPLEEMARIYETLGLPGFEDARAAFQRYIDSQSGYKKNRYVLDAATVEAVSSHWAGDIERWGYKPPAP